MKEVRVFDVKRDLAGGAKGLNKKVEELLKDGWTINQIWGGGNHPIFYVAAERDK